MIKSHEKLITYQTAFKSEMHPKMIPNLLLPFVTNCGAKLMSYYVTYFLLCEDAYNNNDFFSLLSCCEKVGQNVFIHFFLLQYTFSIMYTYLFNTEGYKIIFHNRLNNIRILWYYLPLQYMLRVGVNLLPKLEKKRQNVYSQIPFKQFKVCG